MSDEVASRDPYTGELVHFEPAASPADVRVAVDRSVAAADGWARMPVTERAAVLRRFADAVERSSEALASLIVREVGKRQVDAEAEVAWTALSARWYADHPPGSHRAGEAQVVRAPLGVVAVVTPWNVPLITPAWKWLPALLAGNVVLWKPSERATAIARAVHGRMLLAGVPADVIQLVPGAAATARELCGHDRVAGVHFTGSEAAGRALAVAAAPRFARVALEMSGINPAVVLADADLELAASCIAGCATALAGQKCTATRRVLVAAPVREELEARLAGALEALRLGDPRKAATDVGPVIDEAARARAQSAISAAVKGGARVIAEGSCPEEPGQFVAPTLLADLAPDDPLRERELFAPVLSIASFATPDEAWELANAGPYGLSASVFSRSPGMLAEAAASVRAGVIALNRRGDDVGLEGPFGGRRRSGNGYAEGGTYVYDALTELQAIYGGAGQS